MTTWCIINGLIRRLKFSSSLTHKSSVWFGVQISQDFLNCKEPFGIELCCSQTRSIHTSFGYYGKKGPKGVPRRRNPLKTDKKTKLERVSIYKDMTILELAKAMNKSTDHVYEVLMFLPSTNEYDHDNAVLDRTTITDIVRKSNMVPEIVGRKEKKTEKESTDIIRQSPPDPDVLVRRSPVVTIMGHVDHGKTTLLDQLRNSNIVDGEFGGITQHIGAFRVTLQTGESICFLDTPGHAAFSAMRSRGARLTDIVVLVVAADDGVMQQTLESIQHAKNAEVPVIIAINKIDKANADVDRTKYMLLEHQIQLEEFGGDVQAVPISALQGTNLLELQEAIVTQAELMNLRGDPVGLVEGHVVEARVDKQRGRLVTAVIQRGTLRRGDFLLAGTAWAKVRAMFDDSGRPVQEVPPATPVEILGWKEEIPSAGDEILQVKTEAELKSALAWRVSHEMKKKQEEDLVVIEEKRELHHNDYHAKMVARRQMGFYKDKRGKPTKEISDTEDVPRFSLVLKGDVDGSVEAILDSLDTYRSKKCRLDIIHFGVGSVTESDVEMAAAFGGEVYAFNVDMTQKVSELAKTKGVPVRKHNIIYRLFESLKLGINRKLPKIREDTIIGEAKVLQVFRITLPSKKKTFVAGCRCTQGNMSKKLGIKVLRNDDIIYEGNISSLKHFKDEVEFIKKEQECGISVDDSEVEFHPQDVIVNYEIKDIDQEIDWDPGF